MTDAAIQDCPTCGLSLTQNQSAPQQSEPVPVYAAPPTQPPASQPPYAPAYGAPANTFGAYQPSANWQPKNQPARRPRRRIAAGLVGALALIAIVVGVFAAAQSNARRVALINANATATAQTVAEHTVLTDPLTSNANGWLDNSHCYFAADGYHIVGGWYCVAPIGIQINGVESVTAKQISGSTLHSYGLVFRLQNANNHYFFGIDSNSEWVATKVVDGKETILQPFTFNKAIKGGLNTRNTLSVTMNDATFDFYVNGQKMGAVHDSTFDSGNWGMVTYSTLNVVYTNYSALSG